MNTTPNPARRILLLILTPLLLLGAAKVLLFPGPTDTPPRVADVPSATPDFDDYTPPEHTPENLLPNHTYTADRQLPLLHFPGPLPEHLTFDQRIQATRQSSPRGIATDQRQANTVYLAPNGQRYHRADCRTIRTAAQNTATTIPQATERGYTPCGVCKP